MKFLHLGDLHLGKSLFDFDLIEDQKYILDEILEIAEEKSVDGILVAGDVYDKSVPSEAAVELLDDFLNELQKREIKVFMVSGNHDSDERLNYGSTLFQSNEIFITAKFDTKLHKQSISDGDTTVDIYMLPFVKALQVRNYVEEKSVAGDSGSLQGVEIKSNEDAVRFIIDQTEIEKEHVNILVAHQFVSGKEQDPEFAGSESLGTQSVGTLEKIGYGCFDQFDYVALGHIHSPQKVGREEVRYAGSPLKYSLSEAGHEKTVPLITVSEHKKIGIELIPLTPKREMWHIKGKKEELLNRKDEKIGKDDFLYVTLTDEDIPENVMGIFQTIYPNTLRIDYDNSYTKKIEQVDISKVAENKSFPQLIGDFYEMMMGEEISPEELQVMEEVAREAGVIYEAD